MDPATLRVAYLGCDDATWRVLDAKLGELDVPHTTRIIEDLADWLASPMLAVDLLVIGPEVKDAVHDAQQLHLKESGVDVVMLVAPDQFQAARRKVALSPYLTRTDECRSIDDLLDCAWFGEHAEGLIARRRSRTVIARAQQEIADERQRRAFDRFEL